MNTTTIINFSCVSAIFTYTNQNAMASSFLGLRTVVYKTTDLSAAKEWYADVLGIQPYFDEPFYVGFNVGGYELGLHPAEGTPPEDAEPLATTYWGVNDVEGVYNKLIAAGGTPVEQPSNVGGAIVVASVRDPWGNIFGIIYNPDFSLG